MASNSFLIFILLGALAIVVGGTGGVYYLLRPTLYQERLGYREKGAESLRDKELRSPFKARVITPFIQVIVRGVSRRTQNSGTEAVAKKLQVAGMTWQPAQFIILQIASLVIAVVLVGAILLLLRPGGLEPLLIGLFGVVFGFLGPRMWLERKIKARKLLILNLLPTAIDNLSGCMYAGLTFQASIAKLAAIMDNPMGREFANVIHKIQIGQTLNTALLEMGERTQVEAVQRFALAVIQSDEFGTPVAIILEKQSEDLRLARKQRAQQKAYKAPIKMLFPMLGCIFPAIFIILMGPAALTAIKAFS